MMAAPAVLLHPWAVRRINCETNPFALINPNGRFGDEVLAWGISEKFAADVAKAVGGKLQG